MDMSDQVIKVLNELSKKIGISIDWSQKNILPQIQDFMHRYVKYETYTSIMWLVIGILFAGLSIFFIFKSFKDETDQFLAPGLFVAGIIVGVIGVIVGITQIHNIIKINTIPEAYFIEYIQNLIQSK